MMNSALGCGAAVQPVPQGFGCRAGMLLWPLHFSFSLNACQALRAWSCFAPKTAGAASVVPGEGPRRDPFTRARHQEEEFKLGVGKKILYLGLL